MNSLISVKSGDVAALECDVLILKYAQNFYGADALVGKLIDPNYVTEITPAPDEFCLLSSGKKIAAENVLFVGVGSLFQFDYSKIRKFMRHSLGIIAKELPNARHIGMTIHGIGYGLDEKEAFFAQVAGIFDALKSEVSPSSLEKITIIEINHDRAARLKELLTEYLVDLGVDMLPGDATAPGANRDINGEAEEYIKVPEEIPARMAEAGLESNVKPHIFVAMPFSKRMGDVFRYGIRGPAHAAGYLCEGMDMNPFVGDILTHIKLKIETAHLVVANLTGSNPNVYLEVGYAWGKDRPTILLSEKDEEVKFDVQGHRRIIYESISDLEEQMEANIAALLSK